MSFALTKGLHLLLNFYGPLEELTVVWAEHSGDLRKAIQDGKRIIISTIEKFPYIISEIGQEHKNNKFAIIIDEAHSGQSGRNSANMNLALSGLATDDEADNEDKINAMMEGRKLVSSASYFAFTATPKNKTEEMFGVPYEEDGEIKHRPFHVYTMKQAIQEGFILDVLRNYTTIDSWYKLMKTVEDDPMFDKKRAQKKLRAFVEGNPDVIAKKAAMMVEHFHEQVIAKKKLGGKARAMVVTASIPRCIEYYYAINKCLADRHSPYKTIVAFSGEHKYNGQEPALTSAAMNGFPDAKIPKEFKKEPYRILIVADMFQTGFDEPLLQTMYVDKPLYDIAAVQTLSRLNRACPGKDEVYVLDFANKTSTIEDAFQKFYRTTILSGETDPNKLYDLITLMESYQVYDHLNPLHKGIAVQLFRVHNLAVYNPSLSQGLPDSDGVHIIQIVLFNLGVETVLFDELGNPALYFGPGQSHPVGAFRADRKRGFAVAPVKLMGQPCGGIFFPSMLFHVADNGVFAFDLAIPVLDSTVNVIVRKWAQQLMELGIGFVCHFPVQPLAKLRHIREQADQLYIVRVENGATHSSITLDHSVFIITMTAGVPVSDILGNSFQNDRFIFLMQLPESRLCRLCLLVGSFRLRLFLGKRKSRGCFHILCFIYSLDLFRFGEEQVYPR